MGDPKIAELLRQAHQARRERRLQDALSLTEQAVALARADGSPAELTEAITHLGKLQRDLGNIPQSLALYEEAAALYRQQGAALALAHTVRHLGDILQENGHGTVATQHYREAYDLYRANPDAKPLDVANMLRGYAIHLQEMRDFERAKPMLIEARGIYASMEIDAGVAECDRRLASIT